MRRLLVGALCGGLLLACGPTAERHQAAERERSTGFRGIALPEPASAPAFTLTDTRGRDFRFPAETAGRVTLLFFGYTHCPDVCPVQVANVAAVLEDLPFAQRSRFRMVFVTTDPERDTPERLRSWLDRFDPSFIGLRGDPEEVNRIQEALGLPPAFIQERPETEEYLVGHASQVVAISPDGRARLAYPFGTRQADWAHDLPLLAEGRWPRTAGD